MRTFGRIFAWLTAGILLIALGIFLLSKGLDKADQLASVLGALAGIAGLIVSTYGVIASRSSLRENHSISDTRQVVESSSVGGSVIQATDVGGSIRIGGSSPASSEKNSRQPKENLPHEQERPGKTVRDTQIGGNLGQLGGIEGDVEVDK